MPRYNPVGFFGHFTIGILAAGITNALLQRRARVERLSKLGVFDAAAVLALGLAGLLIWRMRHAGEFDFSLQQQPYMFPVYAILFGIVLFSAPFSRYAGRVLDNRFFRYTAKVSFGLYIWHYLFITLIEKYGLQDYHFAGVRDVWRWLGISLTVVAISYAAATLSYYLIEQPFINWSKGKPFFRRKPKEKPAEAAA